MIDKRDRPSLAGQVKSLNRRDVMSTAAVGVATLAFGHRRAFAAADNVLKIGFISPRSGPLAGFGEADGYVLDQARKVLAGGIQINGKTYQVELLDRDTQSDPSRASQLANTLINNDGVDLMLAVSTPETINPVADASEAAGVPCLSTVMPWEAWYFGRGAKPGSPSPFKWTYHFGFGVDEFLKAYISQWSLIETNRKVGVLYPNDADGNAIRANLAPKLAKAGFTLVDPGPYETGTADFSAQIATFKREKCEIFNTFPIPPDFAAFWRQAAQQGYTKIAKIVQVAKTGLFASDIEALGDLGINISSAAYWHRMMPYTSSLTGVSARSLADGYERDTGKQWNQQLGESLALIDAGVAALKTSADPKHKASVARAIATLKTDTIGGRIDFTAGPVPNVAHGPLIGTQWVKAPKGSKFKFEYVVTENVNDKNVPIEAKLIPYNI